MGNYTPDDEQHEMNEPDNAIYRSFSGNRVRIHDSFEDQENEMIAYWASVTPLQRLTHLHEMIQISFKLTKDQPTRSTGPRKINIIKYEA